jgi:catechol 2,3-dioxygenase-like lactoylglutathione lyase family enzyme
MQEIAMFRNSHAISGFSTNDIGQTKDFYAGTLGLEVTEANGMLTLHLAGGGSVLVYPKDDHQAATYTALNFPVQDINQAVDGLVAAGIVLERYEDAGQDERGIAREYGPPIAWFKDPAGNILAVVQQ